MKGITAIIAFVVGVALTAVACSVFGTVREGHGQVQLWSDVHDPMRECLDDIAHTYDRGDAALAEQKTRLLQRRWSEYLETSGPAPEQFSNEVKQLGDMATRPAN
jgi:hypothetical protein